MGSCQSATTRVRRVGGEETKVFGGMPQKVRPLHPFICSGHAMLGQEAKIYAKHLVAAKLGNKWEKSYGSQVCGYVNA